MFSDRIRFALALGCALVLAACDAVGPVAPGSTDGPRASLSLPADTVWFAFDLAGPGGAFPDAPGVAFEARRLTRGDDGAVVTEIGRLRFSEATVAEAGGRTRAVRYVEAGDGGPLWAWAFVGEVPDLDGAERAVLDWISGGRAGGLVGGPGGGITTNDHESCRVEQLDPEDPLCNDQDPDTCWGTVCDRPGGPSAPPPAPPPPPAAPSPPPPTGPPSGGGGGGPGNGGGPGAGCSPGAINPPAGCEDPPKEDQGPQIANGDEMRSEIKSQCRAINDDQKANRVFQGSIRAALNAVYEPASPSPGHSEFHRYPTLFIPNTRGGGPLDVDGYAYGYTASERLVSAILEVKNSSNITVKNVGQAEDHIRYLASQEAARSYMGTHLFGYASHAGENAPRIKALAAFANTRGVNFAHVSIHWTNRKKTALELESGIVGIVNDGDGPLAWWHQVLFRIDRTHSFSIECDKIET